MKALRVHYQVSIINSFMVYDLQKSEKASDISVFRAQKECLLLDQSPANGMREVEGDNMTTGAASGPGKQGRLLSSIFQLQTVDTRKRVSGTCQKTYNVQTQNPIAPVFLYVREIYITYRQQTQTREKLAPKSFCEVLPLF